VSWDYEQSISPDGFGLFSINVWITEGDPLDVTFFRDVPAIVEQMDWADPFGPAYATIRFAQCTGFDGPTGDTWWLRENVNVDIAWIPASTTSWHAGEQMIIHPLTNQRTLYLHELQQDGTPQPNIWEGFTVSLSPTTEGVSMQCQGALFQLDRYYAKPLNPMKPRSVEGMFARYFDRRRRGIWTHDLVIPELSDPEWHIIYDGLVDRGQGDLVPAENLGSKYIPVDLTTDFMNSWVNPNSGPLVTNSRWTGFLTRYSGNASWEKVLTGYIMGQLSYMYSKTSPDNVSVVKGDQWTITMDPGRIPRMYLRRQNNPVTLVAWYGQPGIEATLNRDGNQAVNTMFGSGKGANASGDLTWTRAAMPGEVPWQTFRPIATDPDFPIYHWWDYYPGSDINPPASDVVPKEPWPTKRLNGEPPEQATILDLPDGYDAGYERLHGIWVSEKYVQFPDGIDEATGTEIARNWVMVDRDPGWAGDITVKVDLRDPLGNIRPKWSIRDGDIIMLKGFYGTGEVETRGTNVFHVTGVTMNPVEGSVTLKVDTKFRDLLSVEEAIARGRDSLVPINSLQVGKRSAMIDDMIVPWNVSRGSGFIPRLAHTTYFTSPFPHVEFNDAGESIGGETMDYPPTGDLVRGQMFSPGYRGTGLGKPIGQAGAYNWIMEDRDHVYYDNLPVVNPDYDGDALYVPVNAGSSNKNRQWACVPVLLSQAGSSIRTEMAAYDKDGKLAPIEFHVSIYTGNSVGIHSMPADPTEGAWEDEGTPHSALWDGAFESWNRETGYYFPEVTAHMGADSMVIGWGTFDQPAGYSPKRKIAGAAGDIPTGMLMDSSMWGWNFFGDEYNARFPRWDPRNYNMKEERQMPSVSATVCIYARIPANITDTATRKHLNWVYFRGRVYKGTA
jgi:hypothetical protein